MAVSFGRTMLRSAGTRLNAEALSGGGGALIAQRWKKAQGFRSVPAQATAGGLGRALMALFYAGLARFL